jgi:hypothetical protein
MKHSTRPVLGRGLSHRSWLGVRAVAGMLVMSVAAVGFFALATGRASAAPVTPAFGPTIDGYASYDPQTACEPSPKPGVLDFRDLLNMTYGNHTAFIDRSCDDPAVSEHKEGRALDYMLDVNNATENAIANDILNWLLATDQYGNRHAMARRLGIMYIIRNRQIWASYRASEGWRPYDGSNPHTDHIHFSFSWAGALRNTTWWTARNGANAVAAGDVTGDGRTDLVARRADGSLALYANTGSNSQPYTDGRTIGSQWQQFSWFLAGDVTGDGLADLVAERPDGALMLYANSGSSSQPYDDHIQIGNAWNQFSNITLADVTGDRLADLLATRPDGTMRLYANTGSASQPYDLFQTIGPDWQQFNRVLAGDVTGDGLADVVATRPDGTLMLYENTGNASQPYNNGRQIGSDWQQFNRVLIGDVTGDRLADLAATSPNGTLVLYPNTGNASQPYNPSSAIGSGWQQFV